MSSQIDKNRASLINKHHSVANKASKYQQTMRTYVHGEKYGMQVTKHSGDFKFGSDIWFKLGQDEAGDSKYLNNLCLKIKVSALSGLSGGSYLRLVNGFATALFKEIEVKNKSNRIALFDNKKEIHELLKMMLTYDAWESDKSIMGYMSVSDRNSASSSEQTFILPLWFIKFLFQKRFPLWKMQHELNFRFMLEDKGNLYQTDHTSGSLSFDINDIYMDLELVDDAGAVYVDKKFQLDSYMFLKPIVREIAVSSGVNKKEEVISDMEGRNISFISIGMTDDSDYSGGDYYSYEKIDTISLESNGKRIHQTNYDLSDFDMKNILIRRYMPLNYRNIQTDNLYLIYYGSNLTQDLMPHNPYKLDHWHNEFTFARYFSENNVKAIFRWNSNITANKTIRFIAYEPQHILLRNGELQLI